MKFQYCSGDNKNNGLFLRNGMHGEKRAHAEESAPWSAARGGRRKTGKPVGRRQGRGKQGKDDWGAKRR